MSRLNETKRAYDRLSRTLDEQLRLRKGEANEIAKLRETLDVAFYLLGWAQFEYLVREESIEIVREKARTKLLDQYAWKYLQEGIKAYPVRKRLELIFHLNQDIRNELNKDYTIRNEAAHNYKSLPGEAKDISSWLQSLEELVDKFEH